MRDKYIEDWRAGKVTKTVVLSKFVRNYLLEKANFACEECGFNKCHPSDGKTILEIDHIDGDSSNDKEENLRVVCPNCHALSPTYRARNKGKSKRAHRRKS